MYLFQHYGTAYYAVLYRDDTANILLNLQMGGKVEAPARKKVSSNSPLYPRKESRKACQLFLDFIF